MQLKKTLRFDCFIWAALLRQFRVWNSFHFLKNTHEKALCLNLPCSEASQIVTAHSRNLSSTTTTSTMTMTLHKCERANSIDAPFAVSRCWKRVRTLLMVSAWLRECVRSLSSHVWLDDEDDVDDDDEANQFHSFDNNLLLQRQHCNYITSNCQCLKSVVESAHHHQQRAHSTHRERARKICRENHDMPFEQ